VEAVRSSGWTVELLEGHEDLVLDVDLDLDLGLAVTASRDTTVKVRGRRQDSHYFSGESFYATVETRPFHHLWNQQS
jgi:hypothetical protein